MTFTPTDSRIIEMIAAMAADGKRDHEIGAAIGKSRQAVIHLRHSYNIPAGAKPGYPKGLKRKKAGDDMARGREVTTGEVARVRALAAKGLPDNAIGQLMGKRERQVRYIRKAHGITSSRFAVPQGAINEHRAMIAETVKHLAAAGGTDEYIGAVLGYTATAVTKIRAHWNIPPGMSVVPHTFAPYTFDDQGHLS